MVKVMFCWKDRPDLSAEECEAHYRSVHMGLARNAFWGVDGFQKLVFSRVRSHRASDYNSPESHPAVPAFDSFVDLYFDSMEQLQAAMGTPALDLMFKDHVNFMETDSAPNIRIYELDEDVILSREEFDPQ